jgi:hypothetical protein
MGTIQYIFIGSLTLLVILAVLFRTEDVKGKKVFLGTIRTALDSVLITVSVYVQKVFLYIGRGAVRQTTHFLVHKLLQNLLRCIRTCERFLRHLQYKNRVVAHADHHSEHVDDRMRAVRDHADTIKVSDDERRAQRRALLK